MSAADESSLEERGLALRGQLQAQRRKVALLLAPNVRNGYPRSVTMRVLLARPELLTLLVSRVAGTRLFGRLHVLLIALQVLRAFPAIGPPGAATGPAALAAPQISGSGPHDPARPLSAAR